MPDGTHRLKLNDTFQTASLNLLELHGCTLQDVYFAHDGMRSVQPSEM